MDDSYGLAANLDSLSCVFVGSMEVLASAVRCEHAKSAGRRARSTRRGIGRRFEAVWMMGRWSGALDVHVGGAMQNRNEQACTASDSMAVNVVSTIW